MLKKRKIEEEEEGFPNNDDIPEEIKSAIVSRLPPKTLTQFKTTCKQWLSLISHPQFPQLHLTNYPTTSGFFVYARNSQTRQQYLLTTARPDDERLIHVLTLDHITYENHRTTKTELVNGLVLFTCNVFAYVVNPTTRQYFKLPIHPHPFAPNIININNADETIHMRNFLGFDESKNQHKILHMRVVRRPSAANAITTEFEVFSLSDYSWRKLESNLTFSVGFIYLVFRGVRQIKSVCVNSVIHVMLPYVFSQILTFDLTTESFSLIDLPQGPRETCTACYIKGDYRTKFNFPFLTQINTGEGGRLLLGLVCPHLLVETNEIDIWILQDYENHVWVRKTISLSADKSWIHLDEPIPLYYCDKDNKLVFKPKRLPKKFVFMPKKKKDEPIVSVPIYDLKNASFKSLNFSIGNDHQFLCSKDVEFVEFKSYVGTISP